MWFPPDAPTRMLQRMMLLTFVVQAMLVLFSAFIIWLWVIAIMEMAEPNGWLLLLSLIAVIAVRQAALLFEHSRQLRRLLLQMLRERCGR